MGEWKSDGRFGKREQLALVGDDSRAHGGQERPLKWAPYYRTYFDWHFPSVPNQHPHPSTHPIQSLSGSGLIGDT